MPSGYARIALTVLLAAGCIKPPPAGEPTAEAEAPEPARILWAGKGPGELYKKGEVRAFDFRQGDRITGRSWGRYLGSPKGEPEHHQFETRIELLLPGRQPARSEGILVVDDRGRLVRGYERSSAAELSFRAAGDELELQAGPTKDSVGYTPDERDTAFMTHSAIFHEELMFGLRELREGDHAWRLLSLSGGAPVEWEGTVRVPSNQPPGTIEVRTSLGELVTLHQGRIISIHVKADRLEIREANDPWPEWSIEAPKQLTYAVPAGSAFTRRDVELPGRAEDPVLAGEILIPTGKNKPPFGAVVFLAGTVMQDRFGFAGPPPVDLGSHEITDALANAGLVVLRYDERGQGSSAAGPTGFVDQLEDARRAVRTLLIQEEVDPDRLLIVGHGEGGWRALVVAAERPREIKGVAMLASPGRPYREVLAHQGLMTMNLLPPELRADAGREHERMLEELAQGKVPPELAAQGKWLTEILTQKPERLIKNVKCSLFLAQGGKDFEVDPKRDLGGLAKAARKRKLRRVVKRYPDLDHLFKPEPLESRPSRYLVAGRHVDTRFLTDLIAWARKVTKKR